MGEPWRVMDEDAHVAFDPDHDPDRASDDFKVLFGSRVSTDGVNTWMDSTTDDGDGEQKETEKASAMDRDADIDLGEMPFPMDDSVEKGGVLLQSSTGIPENSNIYPRVLSPRPFIITKQQFQSITGLPGLGSSPDIARSLPPDDISSDNASTVAALAAVSSSSNPGLKPDGSVSSGSFQHGSLDQLDWLAALYSNTRYSPNLMSSLTEPWTSFLVMSNDYQDPKWSGDKDPGLDADTGRTITDSTNTCSSWASSADNNMASFVTQPRQDYFPTTGHQKHSLPHSDLVYSSQFAVADKNDPGGHYTSSVDAPKDWLNVPSEMPCKPQKAGTPAIYDLDDSSWLTSVWKPPEGKYTYSDHSDSSGTSPHRPISAPDSTNASHGSSFTTGSSPTCTTSMSRSFLANGSPWISSNLAMLTNSKQFSGPQSNEDLMSKPSSNTIPPRSGISNQLSISRQSQEPSPYTLKDIAVGNPQNLAGASMSVQAVMTSGPLAAVTTLSPVQLQFEDCTTVMRIRNGAEKKESTRSCFTAEKRLKVAETRKRKACATCHIRRVQCEVKNGLDVCVPCIKQAARNISACNLSLKQDLKSSRFAITDFYNRFYRAKIELEYNTLYESCRAKSMTSNNYLPMIEFPTLLHVQDVKGTHFCIRDFFRTGHGNMILEHETFFKSMMATSMIAIGHSPKFRSPVLLYVEVQRYSGDNMESKYFKVGRDGGAKSARYTTDHYRIVPNSLPSVDLLDIWGREFIIAKCAASPQCLHNAIDVFSLKYCQDNRSLPLKALLHWAMRIVSLTSCWTRQSINYEESMKRIFDSSSSWSEEDKDRGAEVSDEVHTQLVSIAMSGIEEAETQVLSKLDKLRNESGKAQKNMGIGRLEWIAVGVCLMRLLLVYRDHTLRYAHGAKHTGVKVNPRQERAQLMYDSLTAVYGATFHNTVSPLSLDWRIEDHCEILGDSPDLIGAIQNLRLQYRSFRDGDFEPQDASFKKLIVKPEKKREQEAKKEKEEFVLLRLKQEQI